MTPKQISDAINALPSDIERKTFNSIEYPDLACTYYMSARALVELVAEVESQCSQRIAAGILKIGAAG